MRIKVIEVQGHREFGRTDTNPNAIHVAEVEVMVSDTITGDRMLILHPGDTIDIPFAGPGVFLRRDTGAWPLEKAPIR